MSFLLHSSKTNVNISEFIWNLGRFTSDHKNGHHSIQFNQYCSTIAHQQLFGAFN